MARDSRLTFHSTPTDRPPALTRVAELFELRIATVRVVIDEASGELESSRLELTGLCRSANLMARQIDLDGGKDTLAEACFGARMRIAEALRVIVLGTDVLSLRKARHSLHRALAQVVQALARSGVERRDSAEFVEERTGSALTPLGELAAIVGSAARAHRDDSAWILDVADTELELCASLAGYDTLPNRLTDRFHVIREEIARWNRDGRPEELGRFLAESMIAVLEWAGR